MLPVPELVIFIGNNQSECSKHHYWPIRVQHWSSLTNHDSGNILHSEELAEETILAETTREWLRCGWMSMQSMFTSRDLTTATWILETYQNKLLSARNSSANHSSGSWRRLHLTFPSTILQWSLQTSSLASFSQWRILISALTLEVACQDPVKKLGWKNATKTTIRSSCYPGERWV